jgi:hypothetical protein
VEGVGVECGDLKEVLEMALVVLLGQEEPGLPQERVEHIELVPVAEVLGLKSSCTGILAWYQVLQMILQILQICYCTHSSFER